MTNVIVTFDPNAKQKFSFTPDPIPITAKTETIHWTQPPGSNFTFAALAFDHPNPFSNVVVHPTEITAKDDNDKKDHNYIVLVEANNTYYSSKDGYKTRTGGPTIKNN
jgi:hypothetical protein